MICLTYRCFSLIGRLNWRTSNSFKAVTCNDVCTLRLFSKSVTDTDFHVVPVNPFTLVKEDMQYFFEDIKKHLTSSCGNIQSISQYHFDGRGKSIRPVITCLMAHACNIHQSGQSRCISPSQRNIAMIAEMIHVASLVHDDVIDGSETRRGVDTVQQTWGQNQAILAGDYIISMSTILLAQIRNDRVVKVMSQILADLVGGEFMQLGSKTRSDERFKHYLSKTFKKTASLMAHCCKSVAILANATDDAVNVAFQYGSHIGIAFQLIDDLLDYVSCEAMLGKPVAADLKLGLATAPVLFASQEYPQLESLIMRRFCESGDVQLALDMVKQSGSVEETRLLASHYTREATRCIEHLTASPHRDALIELTNLVLNRTK